MKKNDNVVPFANDIQKAKNDFKQMIDNMEEEEFLEFVSFIDYSLYGHLDDEDFEEDCDCELCEDIEDYESPFSGEMINFKCSDCGKFSAVPIEIVNDIYEATQEPLTQCFNCENEVSPASYTAPDGKIFNN